jgi:cobalt-zinc-cadmium efflux system outer membrane protein
VARLRLPKKTPENEAAYAAAVRKLFPSLSDPPTLVLGPEQPRRRVALAELEASALANSPVIAQYEADITAQVGQAIQAGTHPNPILGYEADTVGSAGTRNYQGVFFTQLIKTWGKLELAQAIENVDLMNTQLALRQARIDLLADVRRQYFALLIAREALKINEAVVRFTHELYRIQSEQVAQEQAAAYEPFQLRTFAVQSRAALVAARNSYVTAWKQMTATLNVPDMPLADVVDDPAMPVPDVDFDSAVTHILSSNTEARAARNGPMKARLVLRLAEITPMPDVNLYATFQRDFTTPGFGRTTYNTQIGVPIPIFDQNKGNILSARGALVRATAEVTRVENDLRSRLAEAFGRFETNRVLVEYQRSQILPDSIRAYRGTYERHIAVPEDVGFADVIVAQQNLLNAVNTYLGALTAQWTALVDIANLLQIESLQELQLQLKDNDSAPEPPKEPDEGDDVSSLVSKILTAPKSELPAARQKRGPATDVAEASELLLPEDE